MRGFAALLLTIASALHAAPSGVAVTLDQVIHPVTLEIVNHALAQAQRDRSGFLLVRLNTPGGLSDATRAIIERLISAPVPVITYVTPSGARAASAGFLILQAGDVAAMAQGTATGAASPVLMSGQMDPVMRKKVENDLAALLRSIVSRRGRDASAAQTAIFEAKSFSAEEAQSAKLIELIARDERQLLDQLHGRRITRFDGSTETLDTRGAQIAEYRKTWRESLLASISDPNVAFILLALGALGVYVEFSAPGLILPGVAGVILAVLGLSALSVLPINWVGAVLLLLGLGLLILEAKFASHGILGAGGAAAMVLGAILLIDAPPELRIQLTTALAVVLPFAAITAFLVTIALKAQKNKVVTGTAGMIDAIGVARTPIAPEGKVFVQGEYWDAVAAQPVEEGARVRIAAIEGLKLRVERV